MASSQQKQRKRKSSFDSPAASSTKVKSEPGAGPLPDPLRTTKWNIDFRLPASHAKLTLPRSDRRPVIRSGNDAQTSEQRRWYSPATRTKQTRAICWRERGGLNHEDLPQIEDRCFVCKIDLKVQPRDRTSYSFHTWERSTANGCRDCGQIVRGVGMFAESYGLQTDRLHIGTLKISSRRGATPSAQRILVGVFLVGELGDMSEHLEFTRTGKSNPPVELEPSATIFDTGTYKQDVFLAAQKLVQDCSATHHHCLPSSQSLFLPTRLLEIQSEAPPTIKLVTTSLFSPEKAKTHYLALSYCWGNPPNNPLRLTVSTSQSLHGGIPTSTLPSSSRTLFLLPSAWA